MVVRARAHTEETERGSVSIIVTELPYQVNKAELVKKIAELARDKKIDGISDVRDESDRQGTRMVVDLSKDARHMTVLNQLFKFTAMQSAFNANMLALVDGQPRMLNLKAALQHYITYRESSSSAARPTTCAKRASGRISSKACRSRWIIWTKSSRRSAGRSQARPRTQPGERFKLSEEQARPSSICAWAAWQR